MTRLDTVLKQLHISLWNILIFHWKIFYLHLQSSSASKKWKNANFLRFADLVHRVRRDPSVTLRKFSPDTTGHGLRITKRPAVWYFSVFLFEKYQFLLEILYFHLESSRTSWKWKNLNVVFFVDPVHRVRRDPRVTLDYGDTWHSTTSRVPPYTSFVFSPLPACFTREQSTVKASLFVKYGRRK